MGLFLGEGLVDPFFCLVCGAAYEALGFVVGKSVGKSVDR